MSVPEFSNDLRTTRVESVQAVPYNFRLKTPFRIATGEYYDMPGAIVQVELENGVVGFGEAQAFDTLLDENSATICDAVTRVARDVAGRQVFDFNSIIDICVDRIPKDRAAMCGIDMALYDAAGKTVNLPVAALLGGTSYSVRSNAVLSMDNDEVARRNLHKYTAEGFEIFKIKVGSDFDKELNLVKLTRQIIGNREIFVDANTGWKNAEEALRYINQLARYQIAWVEQPLVYDDIEGHKYLVAHSSVPIMLDESLYTPEDAYRLISEGACDMVNIKLSKSGGLSNALRIAAIAQAAKKPIMMGSNLETGLGCLAGYQFAKAVSCITTAMGVFSLMDNDFKHPLVAKDGFIEVKEEHPGLGYSREMEEQLKTLFK